ncbi:MAG: hypothetical protein V8R80_04485 [Eubacterium sp.]
MKFRKKEKPIFINSFEKKKKSGFLNKINLLGRINFPDFSDNPRVQFLNKYSLVFHGILACALVFVIEWISRHSFTSAVSFCFHAPLTYLYNVLLVFASLLIVYLFKRRAMIRIVLTVFWLLLGIVNGCILASRVTPFNFTDLKLVGDLLNMKSSKYFSMGQEIAVIALLVVLAIFLVFLAVRVRNFRDGCTEFETSSVSHFVSVLFRPSQRRPFIPIFSPDISEIWHRDIKITDLYTVLHPVWSTPE